MRCWLAAPDRAQAQAAERLTAELRPGVLVHLTQQARERQRIVKRRPAAAQPLLARSASSAQIR